MNILIVGGGSIGRRHLQNLQDLGYHDIWVLKRRDDPTFASKYKVNVITSFEQAKNLNIDCLFVATPTSLHIESLRFAVENNLHVFMEKPLIHTSEGLEQAKALMKDHGGVFFIGFMLRYHPLVKKIKSLLDEGGLGPAFNARFSFGSYLPYWHPYEDFRISYAAIKELGGGVINTISHELDLIQYFFGNPKTVYCQASNFGHLGIDVEENCEAIFEYPDKVISLHLDYLQKDYDRTISILCENGKIVWNWHDSQVKISRHSEDSMSITLESFEVSQLYVDEVIDFIAGIKSGESINGLNFDHAVTNTDILLNMHKSSEDGRKINLNEII